MIVNKEDNVNETINHGDNYKWKFKKNFNIWI